MTLLLGIETSCDETATAVVDSGREIRANLVASQEAIHAPWGGVVPELASRAHTERITQMIQGALAEAGVTAGELAGVAVTARPGLIGALLVGVCAAKAYAWSHALPLIDVNHIEAHVYSPCLEQALEPPYLSLVASGGHTALYRAEAHGDYRLLGQTRDDAAGEAFDKVAAMLGLGYPGGPLIDREAAAGNRTRYRLPRTMLEPGSDDFSFSGLKTAVLYKLRGQDGQGEADPIEPGDMAASFQEALVDVLVAKLAAAAERTGVKQLALAGGVASNSRLRERVEQLCSERGWRVFMPPAPLCTDNAAMIAGLGYHHWKAGRRADWRLEPRAGH